MERPKIETNGTNAITILEFKASTISSSEAHIQNKIVVNKFFAIILTFVAILGVM
jgi:hypothetical protein